MLMASEEALSEKVLFEEKQETLNLPESATVLWRPWIFWRTQWIS